VSLQHDELLAQECVFEYHLRLAAGKVQDGIQGKGLVVRHCTTSETLLDRVAQRVQASSDEGQEAAIHGPPSWSASDGHDYTTRSDLETKYIDAIWFSYHSPNGLLILIGWPRDG
jgi:hypothetical protein